MLTNIFQFSLRFLRTSCCNPAKRKDHYNLITLHYSNTTLSTFPASSSFSCSFSSSSLPSLHSHIYQTFSSIYSVHQNSCPYFYLFLLFASHPIFLPLLPPFPSFSAFSSSVPSSASHLNQIFFPSSPSSSSSSPSKTIFIRSLTSFRYAPQNSAFYII